VVLPFANIGGNSEQDYFVDGVTESLTTDLSRISGAFVIARNTAFTFKGKAVEVHSARSPRASSQIATPFKPRSSNHGRTVRPKVKSQSSSWSSVRCTGEQKSICSRHASSAPRKQLHQK
jgi:hypothetical protein